MPERIGQYRFFIDSRNNLKPFGKTVKPEVSTPSRKALGTTNASSNKEIPTHKSPKLTPEMMRQFWEETREEYAEVRDEVRMAPDPKRMRIPVK